MKTRSLIASLLLLFTVDFAKAVPIEGFFLPDSVLEVSFRYKSINNLIVLPVRINGTEIVNLVLDTGCRNLVLFGKRFRNMISDKHRQITFSGLGRGKPAEGFVTLDNNVSFDRVTGKRIAIVVVPERNVFANYPLIDGIIGYEVFMKFEIEIDFMNQKITFRPAKYSYPSDEFKLIPLRVEDSRPVVSCRISFSEFDEEICDLLIDTGSCLGLLYTAPKSRRSQKSKRAVLGRGVNGDLEGRQVHAEKIMIGDLALHDIPAGIVESTTHHYASLGTEVLKDYTLLINYYRLYAGLRENPSR